MSFRLTYATMFNPPAEMHVQFETALARLESGFGRRHPLFVAGADREPADWATKHSPIDTDLVLGEFPLADAATALQGAVTGRAAGATVLALEGSSSDAANHK